MTVLGSGESRSEEGGRLKTNSTGGRGPGPERGLEPRLRWFRIARVPCKRDRPAAGGARIAPPPRRAHPPQKPDFH